MPSSTPSSVSRYRPAILFLTGAAAAYTAYLVYNSLQSTSAEGLHRSNAVRRPNSRARSRQSQTARNTTRIVQHLQQDAPALGEFDFFGTPVELDPRHFITVDELHGIAHQARPDASPEQVEHTINQLIDEFLDRLLNRTFPNRPLSPAESSAVMLWIVPQIPDDQALTQALQRHANSFAFGETITPGVAESVVGTELSDDTDDDGIDPDGQTLQRTLYHIAEDRARQEGVIHRGITCNGCDEKPIRGIRWRCANCPDFDLCSNCEATNSHTKTHIFYKIRVPAPYSSLPKQEPLYPGKPSSMSPSINSSLKKRLVSETKMEAEEIEALWDQFTCLAGSEWDADPNHVCWALDRRAFNHAFVPRYASFVAAPNLIYDRIFAYYDTDRNGLIGFEEWIKGLDGMHTGDLAIKYRIVFNGYDVDGDGYISRKDVLRIFRAFYAIEKEATRNYLAESAEELSVHRALDLVRSSQPLGSAFGQNGIPAPNPRNPRLQEKTIDGPEDSPPVIFENEQEMADREDILKSTDLRNILFSGLPQNQLDQIVRDRWARRQFYVDEEEGFTRPEGAKEAEPDNEAGEGATDKPENSSNPDHERRRSSRSSSRVRFQDDVDIDTRSNASTSSRPIGERWGGYEIPEPEKDLGREVLYQITQQAFNELLNPLFQDKEDNAMDAFDTRAERRERADEIEKTLDEFKAEKDFNRAAITVGIFRYTKCVINILSKVLNGKGIKTLFEDEQGSKIDQDRVKRKLEWLYAVAEYAVLKSTKNWDDGWLPEGMPMWNAKLCRIQLQQEFIDGVVSLGTKLGWISTPAPESPRLDAVGQKGSQDPHRDPTMPQFRPNSLADIEAAALSSNSSGTVLGRSRATSESSEHNASDTSSDHALSYIQHDADDLEYYYESTSYGPYFLLPSQDMNGIGSDKPDTSQQEDHAHDDSGNEDEHSAAQPASATPDPIVESIPSIPQSPTISSLEPSQYPTLPQIPVYTVTNNPVIHLIWVNTETGVFHCIARDVRYSSTPYEVESSPQRPLERKIRKVAMNPDTALHLSMLASLETVEKEISDRKGSGLLNFEEFEEHMQQGRLRFLESWMDWVSF